MKKQIVTPLLWGFSLAWAMAQVPEGAGPNLVPNPSFEDRKEGVALPKDDADGSASFRQCIALWTSPTMTTPDWYIVPKNKVQEAKKSGKLINEAHSGIKMVGILTHNPESDRSKTYREYIQVKLDQPTKVGKEYYFEYWVCHDYRYKYVSNHLDLVLSPTPIFRLDEAVKYEPLTDIKPDYAHKDVINKDKREWVRISGTMKAANRSNYLIIGNFFDNKNTNMVEAKREGDFNGAYYMIDDVALHEVHPEPEMVPEPEPIPEPVTLVEEPMEVGKTIELDHVYFETAKWKLLDESTAQLNQLVELMNKYPQMEIEIAGHTDDRGTDEANDKLSKNRTKSVYEYLIGQGIAAERMKYVGYGEKSPKVPNDSEDNRAQNRRVEFKVTKLDDKGTEFIIKNEKKDYQGGDELKKDK